MCEVKAYLKSGEKEELILETVERVDQTAEGICIRNLFGEQRTIQGVFSYFDADQGKIVFQRDG